MCIKMRKNIVVLCSMNYNIFVWNRSCTAFAYMDFACLLRKTSLGAAYTGGSEPACIGLHVMYTYWYWYDDRADKIKTL